MSRYLITGIAGFMGSSIAHECVASGHEVRGIDNLSTGSIDNIADISEIEFYRGNVTDRRLLREICKDVDVIFHYAAFPSVNGVVADPLTSHTTNVDGTLHLLLEASRRGVRRVIFAASASAYGQSALQPTRETMLPKPLTLFATQKVINEYYMKYFAASCGVETVSLRYFNVFGPRQVASSPFYTPIAHLITSILSDKAPEIPGDGRQELDFTYIDDAVQANMLAALAPSEAINGRVFNIASGHRHTLLDSYKIIADAMQFEREPKFLSYPKWEFQSSLADIKNASELLHYHPRVPFRSGLEQTVEWYRDSRHRHCRVAVSSLPF